MRCMDALSARIEQTRQLLMRARRDVDRQRWVQALEALAEAARAGDDCLEQTRPPAPIYRSAPKSPARARGRQRTFTDLHQVPKAPGPRPRARSPSALHSRICDAGYEFPYMDQAPGPAGMHGGVWATDVRASRGVDTFLPGASNSAVASSPPRWRHAAVRVESLHRGCDLPPAWLVFENVPGLMDVVAAGPSCQAY